VRLGSGASAADALLGRVVLAFVGERLPRWVARRLADAPAAGMTVFRHHNVRSPGQVRELTAAFQRAAVAIAGGGAGGAGTAPLLVAADQEGGQLRRSARGPAAGNMALGAVADADLAERVGRAIGLESRAMGSTSSTRRRSSSPRSRPIRRSAFGRLATIRRRSPGWAPP
jgi:beta-N-acetylhexosaminidase